MNQPTVSTSVTDELAAALKLLLGAVDPNGIISKGIAIRVAGIALEHYAQSKKDKSHGNQ